jgi:hypothetical protein
MDDEVEVVVADPYVYLNKMRIGALEVDVRNLKAQQVELTKMLQHSLAITDKLTMIMEALARR